METQENPRKPKFSRKQRIALDLWFTKLTQAEIAEQIGVRADTISAWKTLPAFQQAIAEREAEAKARAMSILADAVTDAAFMLTVLANRGDRQACVDVLKAARVYVEKQGLEVIATIEESVEDVRERIARELEEIAERAASVQPIE